MSARVQCYVYDISQGMSRAMSMAFVGKQVDIIPHTGIVVQPWNKEYFFGGGVCIARPGQSVPLQPCEILELGTTSKTEEQLTAFLREIQPQFTQATYNLLTHNCNHLADRIARFLTDNREGVPARIVNIANEALSTPQGQNLRGIIEQFDANMRANNEANVMNPFGGTGGGIQDSSSYGPAAGGMAGAAPSAPSRPAVAAVAAPDMGQITAALGELGKVPDVEQRRACLGLLVKMSQNIVDNKGEEKFRKIKMSNAAFTKKVGEVNGGTEVVLAMGFLPDEVDGVDHWVFQHATEWDNLKGHYLPAVKAKLNSLPAAPAAKAAAPAPMAGSAYPGGMGAPPMGGMGGMGNPAQMQQMMNNPAAMQAAMQNPQMQQMMQNPAMMQQAQQMMQNDPQMQQMMQQMMSDPNAMQNLQNMMNGMGGPPR